MSSASGGGFQLARTVRVALVAMPLSIVVAGAVAGQALALPAAQHNAVSTTEAEMCAERVVGTWSAQVTTTVPSSGTVTYVFSPGGSMTLTAGTSSVPGTWQCDHGNAFSFTIDQVLTDGSGNVTGHVHATQNGWLHGDDRFTSSGTTVETDANGQVVRTFQVNVTATRVHHG